LYPLLLIVVPNFDPSISRTLVTTVAGSPESGRMTTGPEPEIDNSVLVGGWVQLKLKNPSCWG
jgi:hypothetical protein